MSKVGCGVGVGRRNLTARCVLSTVPLNYCTVLEYVVTYVVRQSCFAFLLSHLSNTQLPCEQSGQSLDVSLSINES